MVPDELERGNLTKPDPFWSVESDTPLVMHLAERNVRLQEALLRVEWVWNDLAIEHMECPWCLEPRVKGHAWNCQRQQALGVGK